MANNHTQLTGTHVVHDHSQKIRLTRHGGKYLSSQHLGDRGRWICVEFQDSQSYTIQTLFSKHKTTKNLKKKIYKKVSADKIALVIHVEHTQGPGLSPGPLAQFCTAAPARSTHGLGGREGVVGSGLGLQQEPSTLVILIQG